MTSGNSKDLPGWDLGWRQCKKKWIIGSITSYIVLVLQESLLWHFYLWNREDFISTRHPMSLLQFFMSDDFDTNWMPPQIHFHPSLDADVFWKNLSDFLYLDHTHNIHSLSKNHTQLPSPTSFLCAKKGDFWPPNTWQIAYRESDMWSVQLGHEINHTHISSQDIWKIHTPP